MERTDQNEYIRYLEDRIKKLTKANTVKDYDLDVLIDTQNEFLVNNASNLKNIFADRTYLIQNIEMLQKRVEMSNGFISFLSKSFWWKITQPLRVISRNLKKHIKYQPFDFSHIKTINDKVAIVIYAKNPSSSDLEAQIKSIQRQKGFSNLEFTVVDLINSDEVAETAEAYHAIYINSFVTDNHTLFSQKLLTNHAKYVVYIEQDLLSDNETWLYKMVRPIVDSYASVSALYSKYVPQIQRVKKESFYNELRSRIFEIGDYECLLLPNDRTDIQFIPPMVIDDVLVIAKQC